MPRRLSGRSPSSAQRRRRNRRPECRDRARGRAPAWSCHSRRTAQGGGDGDGVALGVEQTSLQPAELGGTLNEMGGRLRRHHRRALLSARPREDGEELAPALRESDVVDLPEPARRGGKIRELWPSHRANRLAFLAGEADLATHIGACKRLRGHDQHEMPQPRRPQRVLDLAPKIAPAFERVEILPDGEAFALEPLPQRCGELRAVLARIGDEDA